MKLKISLLCLLFAFTANLYAQEPGSFRRPKITLLNGFSGQLTGGGTRSYQASADAWLADYTHIGVQYNYIFPDNGYNYYDNFNGQLQEGSFQMGFHLKYFLHGKYTGRKSGIYFGPEFRFGTLKQKQIYYIYTPVYSEQTRTASIRSTAVLMRIGKQWNFGKRVVAEINLPFGLDYRKRPLYAGSGNQVTGYVNENFFTFLPAVLLGFTL